MVAVAGLLSFGAAGAALVQGGARPANEPPRGDGPARFTWIDVFVDSGASPLAAYQVEVRAATAPAHLRPTPDEPPGTPDEPPAQAGDDPPRSGALDDAPQAAEARPSRAASQHPALLVGVEGGDHAAFVAAPYYDPAALHEGAGERIVLAAFSTNAPGELPSGKVRVARLHVRVIGDAADAGYQARLVTAANADGKTIEATASLSEGDSR